MPIEIIALGLPYSFRAGKRDAEKYVVASFNLSSGSLSQLDSVNCLQSLEKML